MTLPHLIAAVVVLVMATAASCFVYGWIACGNYSRRYRAQIRAANDLESPVGRTTKKQPVQAPPALPAGVTPIDLDSIQAPVVHLHLHQAPQPQMIDAGPQPQIIEAGWS